MKVRVAGDAAGRVAPALTAAGIEIAPEAPALVHATLDGPDDVAGIEETLAAWISDARRAAADGGDVVTVVGDGLLDGDEVPACAVGHGLVSATRALAMERGRTGEVANVVVADPDRLPEAATAVAWLLRDRVLSGEVLHPGTPRHGRQRP